MTARKASGAAALVPLAELAGHLDATGLALDADASPGPTCILVDLDEPVPGPGGLAGRLATATPVLVGMAQQPLSAEARALARELACTLVPVGHEADPCLVAVADPLGAAHRFARRSISHPAPRCPWPGLCG